MTSSLDPAQLSAALGDRYTIVRELGQGGMATVYLANDARHARQVAIKVLGPELYSRSFAERFLSEIRVTAGLQHPHILPLFDSGASDEMLYYVMPYVEGETLRNQLQRGAQLPVMDAIRIATEVASALDFAHRHGVIHRDIKPENILFQDGNALVADFGIAISLSNVSGERLTATGFSIGTPTYMSPEQASGERELDKRSDVYALGVVLYEMLAGATPHVGHSAGEVLAKLLTRDPAPLTSVRGDITPQLAAVVSKALARDPDERWETAAEFASALRVPPPVAVPMESLQPSTKRPRGWIRSGVAVLAVAALSLTAWRFWPRTSPIPVVTSKRQVTFVGRVENSSISPDGRFVAYATAEPDSLAVFVQELSGGNAIRIAAFGTADLNSLAWSPDGARLLLTATSGTSPIAYLIPRLGGDVRALPAAALVGDIMVLGAWLPDGERVSLWPRFDRNPPTRMAIINTKTGESSTVGVGSFENNLQGSWSPDATRLVMSHAVDTLQEVWIHRSGAASARMYSTVYPDSTLANPQWSPAGDAVLALRGLTDLVRIPLRRDGTTPDGAPQTLATGLEAWGWAGDEVNHSALSFSADGSRAVYTRSVQHGNIYRLKAGGGTYPITATTTRKVGGTLSPDGQRIAYAQRDANGWNVYVVDATGGTPRQLTFAGTVIGLTRTSCLGWSPDSRRLAAAIRVGAQIRVGIISVNGDRDVQVLQSPKPECTTGISWSPSRRIAYATQSTLHLVDPDTDQDSLFVASEPGATMYNAIASADEGSAAYYLMGTTSERSGLYLFERGKQPRRLASAVPLGLSADGSGVLARPINSRDLWYVGRDGKSRVIWQAAARTDDCTHTPIGRRDDFTCTTLTAVSDAWLLELKNR